MNNPKPSEIIAVRFQVSKESAKYFLIQVQKCFKTERPPHALIHTFVDGLALDRLPRPYQVARMMHDEGIWAQPMNAEPQRSEDEADVYIE